MLEPRCFLCPMVTVPVGFRQVESKHLLGFFSCCGKNVLLVLSSFYFFRPIFFSPLLFIVPHEELCRLDDVRCVRGLGFVVSFVTRDLNITVKHLSGR